MLLLLKRRKSRRRIWIHAINGRRKQQGDFHNLLQELRKDDDRFFKVCHVINTEPLYSIGLQYIYFLLLFSF